MSEEVMSLGQYLIPSILSCPRTNQTNQPDQPANPSLPKGQNQPAYRTQASPFKSFETIP